MILTVTVERVDVLVSVTVEGLPRLGRHEQALVI